MPRMEGMTYIVQQRRVPASSGAFPLGSVKVVRASAPTVGKDVMISLWGRDYRTGWDTDEHLPIIDGIGVLEEVNESSDGRVLHVEGETGVAVLQLLDSLGAVVFLQGRVRTQTEVRLALHRIPFGTWRRTWT